MSNTLSHSFLGVQQGEKGSLLSCTLGVQQGECANTMIILTRTSGGWWAHVMEMHAVCAGDDECETVQIGSDVGQWMRLQIK